MPARLTAVQLDHRRRAVVHAVATGESTLAAVCHKYRISPRTFYRWKCEDGSRRACTPLAQRLQCVQDVQSGRKSIRHACRERGISIRTYYRWLSQKDRIHTLLSGLATPQLPQSLSNDTNVPEQPCDDPSEPDDVVPERLPMLPNLIMNERQLPSAKPTTPNLSMLSIALLPNASREDTQPSQPPSHAHPVNILPPDQQHTQPPLNPQDAQMINDNEQILPRFHTTVSSDLASEHPAPPLPSAAQQSLPLAHQSLTLAQDRHQPSERALPAKRTEPSVLFRATAAPLQAVGHPKRRVSSAPVSSTNEGADPTPPTASTGMVLPPRARRCLRRPQIYRDSLSPSEHSVADPAAQDPPDKHRIVVRYYNTEASLVWYAGATAGDIKAAIARRFRLPASTFFTLRDDVGHEVAVSEGLPSGTYDLLL